MRGKGKLVALVLIIVAFIIGRNYNNVLSVVLSGFGERGKAARIVNQFEQNLSASNLSQGMFTIGEYGFDLNGVWYSARNIRGKDGRIESCFLITPIKYEYNRKRSNSRSDTYETNEVASSEKIQPIIPALQFTPDIPQIPGIVTERRRIQEGQRIDTGTGQVIEIPPIDIDVPVMVNPPPSSGHSRVVPNQQPMSQPQQYNTMNYNSTVTFLNQSGENAIVKVIGPVEKQTSVGNGNSSTISLPAGNYIPYIQYGSGSGASYSKGDMFSVTETATSASRISITLHKVIGGNYGTKSISKKEFETH